MPHELGLRAIREPSMGVSENCGEPLRMLSLVGNESGHDKATHWDDQKVPLDVPAMGIQAAGGSSVKRSVYQVG